MTRATNCAASVHNLPSWGPWPLPGEPKPPAQTISLLRCEGSLTAALREHSDDQFSLAVVGQAEVSLDHFQSGPLRFERGIVREVVLSGAGVPWVFAQTIIPLETAQAETWLTGVGKQPLGDALFQREDVVRSPIEFARLGTGQALHDRAGELDLNGDQQPLWARRSCFFANGSPLLVTEVFLPDLCPIP